MNVTRVKIIVTIPKGHTEKVRNAICEAGAGVIGNYTNCSTATSVLGTCKPNSQATPYIGTKEKLEFLEEDKLEVVCDISKVKAVLKHLRNAHPYEEPAIDIIPLLDESVFN